jgi:transglutaminase-like putative cysteine protease
MVALDIFNGTVWGTQADAPSVGTSLPPPPDQPDLKSERVTQQFNVEALQTRWLPAAYRAFSINPRTSTLWLPDSFSLVTRNVTSDGSQYTVVSDVPDPTRAQLLAADGPIPADIRKDLALPDGFPSDVTDLAKRVTAGLTRPYEKALALQRFLRSSYFTYDTNVPPGHSDHALQEFLLHTRRGYCEQFAGSFAAMARAVGLPSRVDVGFTHGTLDSSGVYHVYNKDAHAWPEVWLQGIGWMPFEPTPGRFEPSPGDPTGTGSQEPKQATASTATTGRGATTTTAAPPALPKLDPRKLGPEFVNAGNTNSVAHHDDVWTRALLAIVVAVGLAIVAVFALAGTALGVRWSRRHRRRRAPDIRDRVTGAWAEALDRLREAGVEPRASATPVEFAMRHAAAHGAGAAGPPLMELARLQTAALFAGEAPSTGDADNAWEQVHVIERTLRHETSWSRRWRRRLDPRALRLAGAG